MTYSNAKIPNPGRNLIGGNAMGAAQALGSQNQGVPSGVSGTLSIPSLNLNDIVSINGGGLRFITHPFREVKVIQSPVDCLILSVTRHRLNTEHSIFHDRILELGTVEDIETARHIREYYEQFFMILKLSNTRLTAFQEKLLEFIRADGRNMAEDHYGVLYRLPGFYYYDTQRDQLCRDLVPAEDTSAGGPELRSQTHSLTCLGQMERYNKQGKYHDYWFKNQNNQPVRISFTMDNVLVAVWDKLVFKPGRVVELEARSRVRLQGTQQAHWVINKFTLC